MTAFTIALTWLTSTAGGFVALTALGRRERSQDLARERAPVEPELSTLGYAWPGLSGAIPR